MSMFRRLATIAAIAVIGLAGYAPVLAQSSAQGKFTAAQYKKALWMVTRFYGAQRSGEGPNWLLMDHTHKTSFVKDADGGHNLAGGWFDCGDHVLFGQTFFYSAYMLAKAYDLFPTGFHDLYHGDYSDYASASGDDLAKWSIESGKPNGIPDLLEELKYATDWIIKAAPSASTFYSQKGDGDLDHKNWVTAGYMSTLPRSEGGESDGARSVVKNPNDGVMPGFAAAALAIMSRIYKKYDPEYAEKCLTHAKHAYAYAKSKKGQSVGAGGYYQALDSHKRGTPLVIAAVELYRATNDDSYKSDVTQSDATTHGHVMDYANPNDLGVFEAIKEFPNWRLAPAWGGDAKPPLEFFKEQFVDKYVREVNNEKVSNLGGGWGVLRYAGNTAFVVALHSLVSANTQQQEQYIFDQVDFILGGNNAKQSFLTGFCEGCGGQPKLPHHRNVFLRDDNPNDAQKAQMTIPARNRHFGYLVGGVRSSGSYTESVTDYTTTEGGIDYNAGLLGALAYIVSKLDPADTSKFGAQEPAVPTRLVISASDDPADASAFLKDTVETLDNIAPLYAYVFDQDGGLMELGEVQCGLVTWSFNSGARADTGCVHAPLISAGITTRLTVTYVFPGANRPSISRTVVAGGVSVRGRNSLAKNGYAITVRPGAVTFHTAGDLKITKVSVYNLQGRQVFTKKGAHTEITWRGKNRPKGMYMVRMTLNNGTAVQRNLMLK